MTNPDTTDFKAALAHEHSISPELGGKSVFDD